MDDSSEAGAGLPSRPKRCEKPGGWEAEESMVWRRPGLVGKKGGAGVAPRRRRLGKPTYLRSRSLVLSAELMPAS
jgi:hypothetical protein